VANLEVNERVVHEIERGRGIWLQLARGIVTVNGTEMREGDGAAVEDEPAIAIEADTDAEFLLFDLG
jgi:redox-sensitive bicupin YhaK (pirin superfamily)